MNASPLAAKQSGMGIDATPAASVQHGADTGPSRVSCGTCLHFLPDTVNPAQGVGRCAMTLTGLPPAPLNGSYGVPYPFTPRTCTHHERNES